MNIEPLLSAATSFTTFVLYKFYYVQSCVSHHPRVSNKLLGSLCLCGRSSSFHWKTFVTNNSILSSDKIQGSAFQPSSHDLIPMYCPEGLTAPPSVTGASIKVSGLNCLHRWLKVTVEVVSLCVSSLTPGH